MVVSQNDWFPIQLNVWGRLSLFLFVTIVCIIALVSIREYLQISSLVESFSNISPMTFLPTHSNKNYFPLNFIVPDEYTIRDTDVNQSKLSIKESVSTNNRFIQAITKTNVKLPLLKAKTETIALEDVERRDSSSTICSAISLRNYLKSHPDSKVSVIDVVDNLAVQVVVPSNSNIFTLDDLKGKVIACGLSGTASNEFLQVLARSRGWVKNRDYIVQEQIPDAVQLQHNFHSRISQIDAAIIVDTYPSPILTKMIGNNAEEWRIIPVHNTPTSSWNLNEITLSNLNQEGNNLSVNTVVTPMVMVANTTYPAKEIVRFSSFVKNPYMLYNLEQVVDFYKLPLHPTSVKIYKSLGFLG